MAEVARAAITTILFTDLVDSTTLMRRVGDERAQLISRGRSWLPMISISAKRAIPPSDKRFRASSWRTCLRCSGVAWSSRRRQWSSRHDGMRSSALDEQQARPLRALVDFDEAWMELRRGATGDRERARALLDAARGPFESIGMPGWLRRADELRKQLER